MGPPGGFALWQRSGPGSLETCGSTHSPRTCSRHLFLFALELFTYPRISAFVSPSYASFFEKRFRQVVCLHLFLLALPLFLLLSVLSLVSSSLSSSDYSISSFVSSSVSSFLSSVASSVYSISSVFFCLFFRLRLLFRLLPSTSSLSSPSPPTRQPLLACRYGIVTVGHVLPLLSCPIFPQSSPNLRQNSPPYTLSLY